MQHLPPEILCIIQEFLQECSLSLVCKKLNDIVKWYQLRYILTPSFEKSLRYLCDPIPPLSPLLHKLYDNALDYWQTNLYFLEDFFIVLRLTRIACTKRKLIRWALYVAGDRPIAIDLFHHLIYFDFGHTSLMPYTKRNMILSLARKIDDLDTKGAFIVSFTLAQTRIEGIFKKYPKYKQSFKMIEPWLVLASVDMNLTNICARFKIFRDNLSRTNSKTIPSLWTMSVEQLESYFFRYPNINPAYPYLPQTPDVLRKHTLLNTKDVSNKILRTGEKQLIQNLSVVKESIRKFALYLETDTIRLIFEDDHVAPQIAELHYTLYASGKHSHLLVKFLNQLSVSEIKKRCETLEKVADKLHIKQPTLLLPTLTLPSFLITKLCNDLDQWIKSQTGKVDVCFHFDKFYNKMIPLDYR